MAIIANTYLTYSSKGNREQLSDMIYNISPEETPFISNAGKGSVDGTYYEWQTDSLAAAAANDVIEGDETGFTAPVATLRLGNFAQISKKDVIVSGTQERIQKAGRKSELAYQLAKKGAELKRDMEFIACQNQAARGGNSTTSRRTAGFESFILSNEDRGATGSDPTLSGTTEGYPNAAPTDGTQRAFTETLLKTVLAESYSSGGSGQMLLVGPAQKQVVSGFAGIAANRFMVQGESQGVIIGAADVYVGDFGKVNVVPSRFSRNRSALLIDPKHVEIVYLRPFLVEDLAKTGDAMKKHILVEWGTKVNHEASQGVIADLS
jgi:hypothetical protein